MIGKAKAHCGDAEARRKAKGGKQPCRIADIGRAKPHYRWTRSTVKNSQIPAIPMILLPWAVLFNLIHLSRDA
jgi:hypothetical protein